MGSKLSDDLYIVYKHTSPSNKVYIGITKESPTKRWANGLGYSYQPYFFRAIVKYGWINFKHEILFDSLTEEEAKNKEVELITKYKSTDIHYGYNISPGGDFKPTMKDETKEKISKSKKGKHYDDYRYQLFLKYSKITPGRQVNKIDRNTNEVVETFDSVAKAAKFLNIPAETLRSRLKGSVCVVDNFIYKYAKESTTHTSNHWKKPVLQYDLSGNFIREYESIAEACMINKIENKHISDVCKGKRNNSCGYIWRYKNEN